MITTSVMPDGRAVACYETDGMHVLGFTTAYSDVPRFHEIRCLPGPAPDATRLAAVLARWHAPVQHTLGVETWQLKTLPVGDMLGSLRLHDMPTWPDVDVSRFVDTPERFGFRRARDLLSHVEQAKLAVYYTGLVRAGVRKPLRVIADELCGGSKSQANNKLALARSHGYLTSAGVGVAGGRATDKAYDLLRRVSDADS